MSKTIIYIVLLGILGFGVYYFIFKDHETFGTDEAGFKVEDTGSIMRIYMADKAGSSVTLDRTEKGWIVDKNYKAITATVNALLTTLAQQDAKYPVPKIQHNTAVKGLATTGIKVELYGKNDKKIRIFYVGGQVNSIDGTYMLIEGAEQPYVVQIPGFEGYLTPRYSTDMKSWRDRAVFTTPADQLKAVNVSYPSEPLNSFTLQRDAANGKLSVAANEELIRGKQLNERRAISYSKFFDKIYCEGFLNGSVGIDSVLSKVPRRCIIDVEDIKGNKQHVDIYWMPVNQRSKNMLTPDPNIPNEYDADRSYAVMNNFRDTVIVQHLSFDKLFRKAYEFYEADPQPQVTGQQVIQPGQD